MLCSKCGEFFVPDFGQSATEQDRCPKCRDSRLSTDLVETRPMTEDEKASFLLPERFRPELVLGAGAFGVVSKCWDIKLRRYVAIKCPKYQMVNQEMFLREARAASQLSHPNIVQIFDVGEYNDSAFIVSEFVDGGTLKHWLSVKVPTLEQVCQICETIADAVACAHLQEVIHRDLKPGNILMDKSDQPRIVDFGLSHSRNSGVDTLLVEGKPIGTPAYMAPEQVQGKSLEIGASSDVYSLGTILYQMLTGRLPFSGNSREVFHSIVSTQPPMPSAVNSRVPAPLEAICMKAMSKNCGDRYPTAREFADDLRGYREGRAIKAYPGMYARRTKLTIRRNFLAGSVAVCCLSLVGGGYWVWQDNRSRNPRLPVMIDSNPPGAQLSWIRFDFDSGEFLGKVSETSTAGDVVMLEPGFYKVQAVAGKEYFEVFRTIPNSVENDNLIQFFVNGTTIDCPHRWSHKNNGTLELKPITIVPEKDVRSGMAWFGGGTAKFSDSDQLMQKLRDQERRVGQFLMDTDEITWQDLADVLPGIRPRESAMKMSDTATGIILDVALSYCEAAGKNLPSVYELQFAATNGGTTLYPWGDLSVAKQQALTGGSWTAGWDSTQTNPPIHNLFDSVGEWTETPFVATDVNRDVGELRPEHMAPTLGAAGMKSPFPESWMTLKTNNADTSGGHLQIAIEAPGGNAKQDLGFRAVRRLQNSR